jgi:hypothetical protein
VRARDVRDVRDGDGAVAVAVAVALRKVRSSLATGKVRSVLTYE